MFSRRWPWLVLPLLMAAPAWAVINLSPCPSPTGICFTIKSQNGLYGGRRASVTLPLAVTHGGFEFGVLSFDATLTFDPAVTSWDSVRWLQSPDVSGTVTRVAPGILVMTVDWFINDQTQGDLIGRFDFTVLPAAPVGDSYFDLEVSELRLSGFPPEHPFPSDHVQDEFVSIFRYGDFDGNGTVDLLDYDLFQGCFTGPGGGPLDRGCAPGDFDGDDDVDCTDWLGFYFAWTATGSPPDLPPCANPTAVGDGPMAEGIVLAPCHPNPANPRTVISYTTAEAAEVNLAVYDVRGTRIRTLAVGPVERGRHRVVWNGRNDAGRMVPSGSYLIRIDTGGTVRTRRVQVVR